MVFGENRVRTRTKLLSFAATTALVGGSLAMLAPPASADPASKPDDFRRTATGAFSGGVVPDGVCAVQVVALGAAGGSSIEANNTNGAGAKITVTYPVSPGTTFSGTVGAGGTAGANAANSEGQGGAPGGGNGGVAAGISNPRVYHTGAGGGGYTTVTIGGTEVVVAGGGGGSGGGHTPSGKDYGYGGDAGLPTGTGVAKGGDGKNGFDGNAGQNGESGNGGGTPGGGQGGQVGAAGAGGIHSTTGARDGTAGSGRTAGHGGADPGADSGAGGGGGYYAGGGGASTNLSNSEGGSSGVSGAGGGGGASYVVASLGGGAATGISSALGAKRNGSGTGANGSVELKWILCSYDLSVDKQVSGPDRATGLTTWTVTVKNEGDDDMAIGDTVTVTDTLPGTPTAITGITAPSGVTCDVTVGGAMKSPVTCGRADGSGLKKGESITIVYTQTLTAPGTYKNTATVTDRGDQGNNSKSVETKVDPPSTNKGETSGLQGKPQSWTPTPTEGTFAIACATTLKLIDPVSHAATGGPVKVDGVGTYTVTADKCEIVFTPESGYVGTPVPLEYQVSDSKGNVAKNTYTPTVTAVTPTAVDDDSVGRVNEPQSTKPLANDLPGNAAVPLVPSTLKLIGTDPDTGDEIEVDTVTVPEGVYTIEIDPAKPNEPRIVFTPKTDYLGPLPTPVDYVIRDANGTPARATYQPEVVVAPPATNKGETEGPQGVLQTWAPEPLAGQDFDIDFSTLTLLDKNDEEILVPVESIEVPDVGKYTVVGNEIHFQPVPTFVGPAPTVDYRISDKGGQHATNTYTPKTFEVKPTASDDATKGWWNRPQSVDPLANDNPGHPAVPLKPETLKLIDPATQAEVEKVTVPEGVYTIDRSNPAVPLIVFTPNRGFTGTPTPVDYKVSDANGTSTGATYQPLVRGPAGSKSLKQTEICGKPVSFDMPAKVPGLDPNTLLLIDAKGNPVTELKVAGEGTWKVNRKTGKITFTPDGCFVGAVTPVKWEGFLKDGTAVTGKLDITYKKKPKSESKPPSGGVSGLPNTGGPHLSLLLFGLGLLGSGGVVLVSRRRRSQS